MSADIRNLLLPAIYQFKAMHARQGEDVEAIMEPHSHSVVAHYLWYDVPTGDSVVLCTTKEAMDRSVVHRFESRMKSLFHKGRERFCVRRLVLADIEKPNLAERASHVATATRKRGKFKITNSHRLPTIRIPRLMSVSPL